MLFRSDVYGGPGNDIITGGSGDDRLFGEGGNDRLAGGKGNDLIDGGAGDDKLSDTAGFNVLIGGAGADKLTGGTGDDLLIAGVADASADLLDLSGLTNIMTEWTNTGKTYAVKIADLTAGVGAELTKLTAATVHEDGVKDTVTGGKGSDWFIVSASDKVTDLNIKLSETKTII